MTCRHKTEVYSRVVGYYRPVQQWNKGKQAEFESRVPFAMSSTPAAALKAKSRNTDGQAVCADPQLD